MRENRTSGSEGREKGNQPFFLTSINRENNGWKPLLQPEEQRLEGMSRFSWKLN